MSTKEILDTIWKYLILLVAVWAMVIMTGHLCMSRFGSHGKCLSVNECSDHCGGFEGLCDFSSEDIHTNIEWIEKDGDSLMIVTVNAEGLVDCDAIHSAHGNMVIATDRIDAHVDEDDGTITIEIETDDDDGPRKRIVRKVVRTTGE
jgi:hypothetical protein